MNITKCFLASALVVVGSSCVDIEGPEMEGIGPSQVLAEVKVKSAAVMIAKGDSHQIAIDLIAMNNDRLPLDPEKIKWGSDESRVVSVSSGGMVRGIDVSDGPVFITVSYEHNYVTKFDTVSIYVTDGVIDANEIKLISLDSNRLGANALFGAPRIRVDLYKNGALVEKGAVIPLQIDEPVTAQVDGSGGPDFEPVYRLNNDKLLIGKFWIRASLNLYGNDVNDSLSFVGLYDAFPAPAIGIRNFPANYSAPIPLLDTLPLRIYQLCATNLILNLSSDTVDVVFSDSTASSTGCAPSPLAILQQLGLPPHGEFIGGIVPRMPPFSAALRKSNTPGVISYTVRKSRTKQVIPWITNHIKQIDVQE